MSERAAFLRAIRASPDDDHLRLVFADWLDDRGDPLGEFVRVQVELEPVRDRVDLPRVQELIHRESVLLSLHGDDWLGAAADVAGEYPAFGPVFRRCFPEMVCLSLDTFLARGAELFASCPTVREVSIFGVAGRGAELAACPHLAHVETLELADIVYDGNPDVTARLCDAVRDARVQRFRLPALGRPQFALHGLLLQLATVIAGGWPRWVEFVPLTRTLDRVPKTTAEALDGVAGRPVTRIIRPSDGRFPLDGRLGHGLQAGHLTTGDQAIAAASGRTVVLARLQDDGRLAQVRAFSFPHGPLTDDLVQQRFQLTPGLVWAREFSTGNGLSLHLWPQQYVNDYLRDPFERPPGMSDRAWNGRGGVLRRWLHEGRFVIEWDGKDFWADSRGRIFSS